MKQIEEALHAMHAENKANKEDKSVETGLYKLKIVIYETLTYLLS